MSKLELALRTRIDLKIAAHLDINFSENFFHAKIIEAIFQLKLWLLSDGVEAHWSPFPSL
jgi:hypothetical protein